MPANFTETGAASTPELLGDVGERWMAAMMAGDFEAAWRQTDRL